MHKQPMIDEAKAERLAHLRKDAAAVRPTPPLAQEHLPGSIGFRGGYGARSSKRRCEPFRTLEEADKVVFEGSYPTGKPFKEEISRKDTE